MAIRYWNPAGPTGDWGSTASWSASDGGGTGATVPVTGDTVYFTRGNVPVTAGFNQTAVDLEALYVYPEYTGYWGDSGNSLTIAVSNSGSSIFVLAGGGPRYNIAAGTNGIDVLDMKFTKPNVQVNLTGGTTVVIRGGKFGSMRVMAGATVAGGTAVFAGMSTYWEDNATDLPSATFCGGVHESYRDIDIWTIGVGGVLTTYENVTTDTSGTVEGTYKCLSTGTIAALTIKSTGVATAVGGPGCTVTALTIFEGCKNFVDDTNMTLPTPTRVGNVR